ncbi:MAG: hypothetical protein IJX39_08070 [Clostridia bacterium]|nr:hypothetical protein [Clostridia bacterium]
MDKKINVRGERNQVAGRDIYNVSGFDNMGNKFIFSPTIMAEIIDAVYNDVENPSKLEDFERPNIEEKNTLNGITQDFFDNVIKECYDEFYKIDNFLKNPSNVQYQKKYAAIVKEIGGAVYAKILSGENLQDILPTLLNYAKLKSSNFDSEKGYWLQVFSYYMYVNCDIGKKK